MSTPERILVIQVAALGFNAARHHWRRPTFLGHPIRAAASAFPALTCTAQATLRTAAAPARHGMVFNGLYDRRLRRPSFWEQSSALVEGPRIWDGLRRRGGTVGMLFWQQSLGESVDLLLSPAPIHTHGGGLIDAVYSKPSDLYDRLVRRVGRRFKLHSYWGPLASRASSEWITGATCALMGMPEVRPRLLLTYLPHLDYALQRQGPRSRAARRAFAELAQLLERLHWQAARAGYQVLVVGDYAIGEASEVVYPNRRLRDQGLLRVRRVRGAAYPDVHQSRAFAVVDHEVAHVYVQDRTDLPVARRALKDARWELLEGQALVARGLDHPSAGELVMVARPGTWFAYPWWSARAEAPDYARHVDIHNKPGFDPCELFFGWPPPGISLDTRRIRGTHGATGPEREVAWWSSWPLPGELTDTQVIAQALAQTLEDL